jgi:effector-binding domain-containing protein
MIETPRIVQSPRQQTAVIHLTIPRDQIQAAMGPAIGEVIAAVSAQGIGPVGPVYSHHFRMDPATFDFEVGAPVSAPVKPTGRVQASELPAGKVVQTTYRGPYEGLGAAWGEFEQRIAAEGHATAENLWERYVAGPESSPDPNQWQTELNRPLKSS